MWPDTNSKRLLAALAKPRITSAVTYAKRLSARELLFDKLLTRPQAQAKRAGGEAVKYCHNDVYLYILLFLLLPGLRTHFPSPPDRCTCGGEHVFIFVL